MKIQENLSLVQWLYNYSLTKNGRVRDEMGKEQKVVKRQKVKVGERLKLVQP
jgi:hypothetical protein